MSETKDTNKEWMFKHSPVSKEDLGKNMPDGVHKLVAYALQYGIDKFYGDMLTLLETLGLSDKQEKAIKDQMRRVFMERYGSTIDQLMNMVFMLDYLEGSDLQNGRTYLGIRQNGTITGSNYLPGEVRED